MTMNGLTAARYYLTALHSTLLFAFSGRILCLAWHDAENVIVTGSVDNLRIWSTISGQAIQRLTLGRQSRGTETIVWAVAVTRYVANSSKILFKSLDKMTVMCI